GPEVRLAVYDSPLVAPRVISLHGEEFHAFVGDLAARTYEHSRERGGRIPFIVIREIVENLIHAYFEGAVISIFDDGNTIRISDQGPGIADPAKAIQPGFTTATAEMRSFIKGVGSGLPVAREQLAFLGGAISIDSNLSRGTVVTLSLTRTVTPSRPTGAAAVDPPITPPVDRRPPDLTARQKKVLLLIAELGSAGPSAVAKELAVSQSTAYRELQMLADLHLIQSRHAGKRTLTENGIAALGTVFKP
ncbi:MAG TPA: ATP-binding protein, partial [Bryobacteraceae bacterium]|nr:ATP-binding protein [Bryobacteraceae bacterium]